MLEKLEARSKEERVPNSQFVDCHDSYGQPF